MTPLNYERLAVAALDALLAGGLEITQHYGSSGLAVGENRSLPHQNSTNEFSPFFG